MASSGEVPGQYPGLAGSEDLDQLKCQLCLEDGLLREVVGMCIDCSDNLCESCYKVHKRSRPTRYHRLIDKEQMLEGQVRASTKDTCTEKCAIHKEEVIKYYCTRHCLLGCTVCFTLGHRACEDVHYIPDVAKELASNDAYGKATKRLNSALKIFKKVSENAKLSNEELKSSCADALKSIGESKRRVDEALGQMEAEMVDKVQAIKTGQIQELAALGQKYRATQDKLQSVLGKVEALQQAGQNCSVFTEIMRLNAKLKNLDGQVNEATQDTSGQIFQVKFSPDLDILEIIKQSAAFGNVNARQGHSRVINALDLESGDPRLRFKPGCRQLEITEMLKQY